ncbi:MAG: hypothetical protein AB7S59_13730, partial [Parvibaculaceae bacterium]
LGFAAVLFLCPAPDVLAAFISRNIVGIFFGCFMPYGAPIADAMKTLKTVVWRLLHYAGTKPAAGR